MNTKTKVIGALVGAYVGATGIAWNCEHVLPVFGIGDSRGVKTVDTFNDLYEKVRICEEQHEEASP